MSNSVNVGICTLTLKSDLTKNCNNTPLRGGEKGCLCLWCMMEPNLTL